MSTREVILLAIILPLIAALAWLALLLARAAARAAAAGSERDAAAAELDRIRHQAERDAARVAEAQAQLAALQERIAAFSRREDDLKATVADMTEKFRAVFAQLSGEALKSSREDFLALARKAFEADRAAGVAELDKRKAAVDELIRPIREALARTEDKLTGLSATSSDLKTETVRLVRALSRPEVRGRYGEIQLRRVAELAGMKNYCDFTEQESRRDADGRILRPDMIVRLPNDRRIVVDAKTNTSAYLEAANARTPEEQDACLERFAGHVADQVAALSRKQYWAGDAGAFDFVVMFLPGDQFLDAALARRPDLLEKAAEQNVILASPSTLIGLLRAVAVGWREQRIAEQARELFDLGRELHDRAAVAIGHVADLGRSLAQAVERYNAAVGSIESRLFPTLRKFEDSDILSAKRIDDPPKVTAMTRQPSLLPDSAS